MKKIILVLFFCTITNLFFSQIKQGKVIYSAYFNYNEDNTPNNSFKYIYNQLNELSGKIRFELIFNQNESLFKNIEDLNSAENKYKIGLGFTKYPSEIYNNFNNKLFYFNNNTSFIFFKPKEFLIKKRYINDWQFINETKTISGKTCFKAIAKDYKFVGDSKIFFDVVAWYCPEIPIKFGPLFYNNLPGLILEIQYDDIKLGVIEINLSLENNTNISKVFGEKEVYDEDYYKTLRLKVKELQEEVDKDK